MHLLIIGIYIERFILYIKGIRKEDYIRYTNEGIFF